MTIQNTTVESTHVSGGGSSFAYSFKAYDESHIKVYVDGVLQSDSSYVVSGVGSDSGGTVTFNTAPAGGFEVRIVRDTPKTQTAEYQAYGRFPAASHERVLDYLTAMIQEIFSDMISSSNANGRKLRADLDFNGYGAVDVGNINVRGLGDLVTYINTQDIATLSAAKDYFDGLVLGDITSSINQITLSAGQTAVNLGTGDNYTRTATNSIFYISSPLADNTRLFPTRDYVVDSDSAITLTESYPDGSVLTQTSIEVPERYNPALADPDIRMYLIAHRGFRNSFPQNTMPAFTSAVRRGAHALECDVQFSADGTAYVFHGPAVHALTDGTGNVNALSDSYINSLKFLETKGTFLDECRIPTFAQVLDYCKRSGIVLYPEIKGYRTQADIELFVDLVELYEMTDQVVVQSFTFSDLEALRGYNSSIAVGYLGSSAVTATYQQAIQDLAELGNSWLLWNYVTLINNPSIKDYADSYGVGVGAWTVNDNWSAKQLMRQGIRHIMSDVQLEVI